jgi:hypothetical protein
VECWHLRRSWRPFETQDRGHQVTGDPRRIRPAGTYNTTKLSPMNRTIAASVALLWQLTPLVLAVGFRTDAGTF